MLIKLKSLYYKIIYSIKYKNREDYFKEELSAIKNEKIKLWVIKSLNILPEYFFRIPASSTGKHHPKFCLGYGGLVRHVKGTIRIALELFKNETYGSFNDLEQDIIIASLLLHDGFKSGYTYTGKTEFNHPILVESKIKEMMKKEFPNENLNEYYTVWNRIFWCIKSHMGIWNTSKYSKDILPLPITNIQRFVHLCDYLASRKWFNFKF